MSNLATFARVPCFWWWCWVTAVAASLLPTFMANAQRITQGEGKTHFRNEEQIIRNQKSKEMLEYMNFNVDPCNDFFDFACGNWPEHHPAMEFEQKTTQGELELKVGKDLQALLEEPFNLHDVKSRRKVKDFYKSCMATGNSSPMQKEFYLHFVKTYGGLQSMPQNVWDPNYDWVRVIATLRAKYGMNILIGLDIDTNLQTRRSNSIYLSEPANTLLPVEICSAETMSRLDIREEPYEFVQKQVAENFRNWFSMSAGEATRIAGDIVTFEFNLCRKTRQKDLLATLTDSAADADPFTDSDQPIIVRYHTGQERRSNHNRGNDNQYVRLNLQQLTQHFGGLIDFKRYVDVTFGMSINDHVYMRDEIYFTHLARLLKTTTKPTLGYYIMYRALNMLSLPSGDLPSKRSQYCTESVLRYFPSIIGEMYTRRYYSDESRSDVENIFQQVRTAFDDSLTAEWMDENTKRAAKQRLAQFKVRFPQYENQNLSDLHIERLDYWHKLELVLKYNTKNELDRLYNIDYNNGREVIEASDVAVGLQHVDSELLVAWGLLQPPLFKSLYPNALKYAMLGHRLARELAFAFDEQGWKRNSLSPVQWADSTAEGFRDRSQCFRTQFSNYVHNSPEVFRNATKLRQLIADSNGLNVAFRAYLGWLDYIDPTNRVVLAKETLPDMNFTNTQLFFINFAQTRCASIYSQKPAPEFLPMDKHSNERYDVNGPLSNFVEFAREFNCPAGSEMNPDDKCVIY